MKMVEILKRIPEKSYQRRKKNGSVEFLFHEYEIQDSGKNEGGDSACPPMPPLRWAMMKVAPVRELSYRGSQSGGGETPLSD